MDQLSTLQAMSPRSLNNMSVIYRNQSPEIPSHRQNDKTIFGIKSNKSFAPSYYQSKPSKIPEQKSFISTVSSSHNPSSSKPDQSRILNMKPKMVSPPPPKKPRSKQMSSPQPLHSISTLIAPLVKATINLQKDQSASQAS